METVGEFHSLTVPPHSLESEQAVLGSLLVFSQDETDTIIEQLQESDFYRKDHRLIFRAINELHQKQQAIDVITVGEYLVRTKKKEEVGSTTYLGDLAANAPADGNFYAYAELIRERAVHRHLIDLGAMITKLGRQPEARSTQDLIDLAEQEVFKITQNKASSNSFQALYPIIKDITKQIEELGDLESPFTGFATGFTRLDQLTNGLQRGDLIVIAGRPSMGKTTFATNIAEYVAAHRGDYKSDKNEQSIVGFFSMEMGADQLVMRLISAHGSVKLQNIRSGKLEDQEWDLLISASGNLNKMKILIDDTSGISIYTLRSRARRLKRENPNLSLIVIDYLQLLRIDKKLDNRTAEVTEMTRILKEMARELNVPVIVLSQLNRQTEQRNKGAKEHRPLMSDLRESGSIEQDADIIMFVSREEVYDTTNENIKGEAKIYLVKQRNGETGDIRLRFEGQYSRFSNPAHDNETEYQHIQAE